jgi:CubicO group peptidase (beta-lactamase class C family)
MISRHTLAIVGAYLAAGLWLFNRDVLAADVINVSQLGAIKVRMQAFVDQNEIAGAVTLVGRRDGVVHLEAVGHRDRETQSLMQKDTLFRIASMTKPITALGIMRLVDDGKVKVDDPVENYLPEFKGQMLTASRTGEERVLKKPARPITVRDLLTHTSGLPGGFPPGLADLYVRRHLTLSEGVLVSSQQPLDFEPGTKWAYCNAGIDTLGRIIEVVSGQSYEEFLTQQLFVPLEMFDTHVFPPESKLSRIAVVYEQVDGQLRTAQNHLLSLKPGSKHPIPAGGLYSTASDLAKLYQMMLRRGAINGKPLISESSIQAMTQIQTGDLTAGFVPGSGFGFGWAIVREPRDVTSMLSPGSYGHGGVFGTQGWIDPKKNLFVILLIQRQGLKNGDASDLRRELQALAFGALE